MFKVFVEYALQEEARQSYLSFMRDKAAQDSRLGLYEGTDQQGLFVEIWEGLTDAEYKHLKALRTDESNPDWSPLLSWVSGGVSKVHIWHFRKVE